MKRKLTALMCCLALAFGGLAVTASPASAHHEQSCYYTYEARQVFSHYTYVPYYNEFGHVAGYDQVPVYTTVWGQVQHCTPISHPPEYHPRDRFQDCVGYVISAGPGSIYWNDVGVIACLATSGG